MLLLLQVADEGKVVQPDSFGTTGAVALEVVQFGAQATRQAVLSAVVSALGGEVLEAEEETAEKAAEGLGVSAVFRHHENKEELFVSDNGNFCLDLFFKRPIPDPQKMHDRLINVNPQSFALTPKSKFCSNLWIVCFTLW